MKHKTSKFNNKVPGFNLRKTQTFSDELRCFLDRTYPALIFVRWVDRGGRTRGSFSRMVINGM